MEEIFMGAKIVLEAFNAGYTSSYNSTEERFNKKLDDIFKEYPDAVVTHYKVLNDDGKNLIVLSAIVRY